MTENTALYVYALLPDRADAAEGVTGLDGRPLRVVAVPGTGVAALVHEATPAPFQGDDDRVRRWVAEQSEAVTTVWERAGSLLPMTFNVLVAADTASGRSAEQRLGDWIREQEEDITGQLDALSGRCELRVEVTLDRQAASAGGSAASTEETEGGARSPGMRRLLAKQREQREKNAAGQLADTLHAGLRRRLLAVAEDLRDRGAAHRDPGETDVLSAALLVRREDINSVGAVLSEAQALQPALRIRFLGPWPPYSFTETRPQAAAEHAAG
ncbi:putative GvpL-like protein 2 [Streptomyces ambofaciens ATCC 23877]|uniref:Putative GvpL-like protein 2 n=1 Tax=Streptomyces ambofaciens (strain ATCC 23877 / 3486 / DSM 40053 / JCM 4204 / NBRC 12836 / NRRL B-2516) TaxID=278992 RepID=A3KIA8_STRA7|nr:GvpL/GvpF family gas vesicle protein [Streptomyces ambofaciens]AKZ53559.1 putative GvpL-like protein 2 [Streptomyces ambofaciens ATCC 23877]CAJ89439.1 putative GvpL-like protein 2 [Streptomyces ambofaciens ATCC 23877]